MMLRMKRLPLIAFLALVALILFAVVPPPEREGSEKPATEVLERDLAAENHVRIHLADLAPEKEVLGGTFYVTEIYATGGTGSVSYEDGHNAYTADFRYRSDSSNITITSFVIRE